MYFSNSVLLEYREVFALKSSNSRSLVLSSIWLLIEALLFSLTCSFPEMPLVPVKTDRLLLLFLLFPVLLFKLPLIQFYLAVFCHVHFCMSPEVSAPPCLWPATWEEGRRDEVSKSRKDRPRDSRLNRVRAVLRGHPSCLLSKNMLEIWGVVLIDNQ